MKIREEDYMEKGNLTLLIMAAGMGSRFGGLKQIEPFGPNGEFLIDYSIYDAIRAGFTKVVFIIKEENYEIFKETIGKRVEDKIPVEYVFQKLENLPEGYSCPKERIKPWGTAHAILSAKNNILEPFAVINADDFYGYDAFRVVSEFLRSKQDNNTYAMVGYQVKNTLTANGSVKRGVCKLENNYLKEMIESNVVEIDSEIKASPLDGSTPFIVMSDTPVSMNMLGFYPNLFSYIEEKFPNFLEENKDNILNCEYLIPDILTMSIKENYAKVKVLPTTAKWEGVTYKEDKEYVVKAIQKLIEEGKYPQNLWKK